MNFRLSLAALRRATSGGVCLAIALAGGLPLWAQGLVQPAQAVRQAALTQKAPPAQVAAAVVEGYSVAAGELDRLAGQLQQRYAQRADVRVAGDARTGRIVVFAPPDVQREVAVWLSQAAAPAAQAPADPPRDPIAAQAAQRQRSLERLHLAHLSWRDFETKLFRIWGARLTAATSAEGDAAQFQIKGEQGTTTFEVDRRRGQVTIDAPGNSARDWLKVLQAIDAPAGEGGQQAEVVQLDKADPSMILRAVSLIRTAMSQDPLGRYSPHRKNHIGQFVSMIFQQEGEAAQPAAQPVQPAQPEGQPAQPMQPGEGQPGPEGQPGAEGVEGDPLDSGRIGAVEIDIVGDVIVVRGRRQDVERVLRIIEEIERQSIETRPEVELYLLKHVDSTALSELITLVYSSAFSYQGTVTITPLQRPNALLLVGRKENIPAIVELIQKLDRPTPPDSRLKVFYLKHMSAIDMERTLRQFFIQRPPTDQTLPTGLGTRVKVIAEFRANAIIVQAAPRDLAEVAQVIAKLDVEDTPSKNEVRVFKLRNSIASELAQPLQEAITGVGVGGQQQQQQQAPGGAGAGGQQSPAIATRPAVSLSIMRIGPEGEQLIQSGVLSNMRITADTRSNSLIVVGPRSAMELMAALIEQLDNLPAADAQIKVFTIVNGDATALTEMLQELFGTQAGGGGQAGQLGLQTATGGGDSTLVPLRFSVDQRTNSIIASGTAGDLDVIYRILARLDEGDVRQRITTVYRLHNSPAADVAAALTQLLTSQRELLTSAPELVTPYQIVEREVIVVPEIVTNSLIVSATPRFYDDIKRVITELDRRPPMVAIQVLIAEVTLSDIDEFGIEWGLQDSLLFDRGIAGGPRFLWPGAALGNDNTPASLATRENLAGQVISDFATGAANGNLGFGGLVLQASNESVSVLLRALQQSQRIQVISRPQVQTLDNQPAFVQVGALVPRVTSTTITNGVSQNNTTDENVGIILGVTPRTSPDGMIVMEVNAEKSEVGPDETGIPISIGADGSVVRSPQIFITTAQTTVSARSGQTVILGGLITKNQGETTRRIPYLGDIPVLGRLFRFDSVSNERRELLIILTPYIIQNDEQNDLLNQRETERMSWCIADVVNIHGPVGVSGNPAFNMHPADVIFPHIDPTAPQEPTPAAPPIPGLPPFPGFQSGPEIPPATPGGFGQDATPPEPTSARRGAELPAELRLQQPMIQPVQPPAGTQARFAQPPWPSGVAPAVYQR